MRGGYGIFYDKILYAIYSDALQQNSTAAGFRAQLQQLIGLGILPRDTDLDRVHLRRQPERRLHRRFRTCRGPTSAEAQAQRDTIVSNERRILNPNGYPNPRTQQFSLGYQRQLGEGLPVLRRT